MLLTNSRINKGTTVYITDHDSEDSDKKVNSFNYKNVRVFYYTD